MIQSTRPQPDPCNRSAASDTEKKREAVVATVPQGYETKINIRLVPGRDLQLAPEAVGCRPRKGAPRPGGRTLTLPEGLAGKLKEANSKVVAWLAQEPANAGLFLARPVEALVKAGVELTRTEQKTLDRAHRAVHEATLVAPGVKVTELNATAIPKGRVGELKPGRKPEKPLTGGREKGCGPAPKGKE